MILDLHGLTESEALLKIDAFLWELISSDLSEATIITGRGMVLRDLVIEQVEAQNLYWSYEGNNDGAIIIYND